ncbi:MAG: beta-ribofuranosylaminobenzene 5'-phosphate synthase [Methanobacteriaceae archaeon]|nr:beta-ribofuranosylaminobenzene 5'-phosphate synthase [Methanobacteriaceae archaeon]
MQIETSARLHVSLIDLNGSTNRIDGSLGITLKEPPLIIECEESINDTNIHFSDNPSKNIKDEYITRIYDSSEKILNYIGINKNYEFNIKKSYPVHLGLGSGTQISLSVAKLLSEINNHRFTVSELGRIVKRGGTSGIGVEAFDKGGIIIDGGHKKSLKNGFLPSSASDTAPPPIIARYDFPKEWKIIVTTPIIEEGASGSKEVNIFKKYTPIDLHSVEIISHTILMNIMPAILEEDLDTFGKGINKIQSVGFKSIERKIQNPIINRLIDNMNNAGASCAGMSSFGPTCFAITDSNTKTIKHAINDTLKDINQHTIITTARNEGAKLN